MRVTLFATTLALLLARLGAAQTACITDPECVDADVCNGAETCAAGFCQAGTPLSCDDGIAGTADTCDAVDGCRHGAPIPGKRLALRAAPTNPLKQALKFVTRSSITVSNPPFSGGPSDPVQHGGSLRLRAVSGEFDQTYPLPASNWFYLGNDAVANRGFWYKDRDQTLGPIRFLVIRDGVMARVFGTGPGLGVTLAQDPQAIDAVLTIGATSYCMQFGGVTSYVQDLRFRGKDAPAPVACP